MGRAVNFHATIFGDNRELFKQLALRHFERAGNAEDVEGREWHVHTAATVSATGAANRYEVFRGEQTHGHIAQCEGELGAATLGPAKPAPTEANVVGVNTSQSWKPLCAGALQSRWVSVRMVLKPSVNGRGGALEANQLTFELGHLKE